MNINFIKAFIAVILPTVGYLLITEHFFVRKTESHILGLSTQGMAPREKVSYTHCSAEMRKRLISTPLLMHVHENVNTDKLEASGCFVVNKMKTGLWRLADERNFKGAECSPTEKRFLTPPRNETRIALNSLPGSGNTWVRYLLEEVTGIYTGALNNDRRLSLFFPGESITHNVVAIKTHRSISEKRYDKAVLIVRDLFESTLAEYNRRWRKNHTGLIQESDFNPKDFKTELRGNLGTDFYVSRIASFPRDMFVLFYEKLKTDLLNSLTKLAAFCKAENVTLERLWCILQNSEGYAYRGEKPDCMSRERLVDKETEKRLSKWLENIHVAIDKRKFTCATN